MSDLTITEASMLKHKLEQDIRQLVVEFENKTELEIEHIEFTRPFGLNVDILQITVTARL